MFARKDSDCGKVFISFRQKKGKKKSINMFNTGRLVSETCVSDTVTNSSHAALFSRRIKGIKLSFNLSQKEVQRQHVNELSR